MATQWCHGCQVNHIPPLITSDGKLVTSTSGIKDILLEYFFPTVPTPIPPCHPDNPPTHAPWTFADITKEEISLNLAKKSNTSAPGLIGIGYKLLKWCHFTSPSHLTTLFCAAITLGHHPWHNTKVVPIPKLNKADYRIAKTYRPISLLECCGKLLKKIVAKCILLDANCY